MSNQQRVFYLDPDYRNHIIGDALKPDTLTSISPQKIKFLGLCAILAIFASLLWLGLAARYNDLYRTSGVETVFTIKSCQQAQSGRAGNTAYIIYTYQTPDGQRYTSSFTQRDCPTAPLLYGMYLPDRPAESALITQAHLAQSPLYLYSGQWLLLIMGVFILPIVTCVSYLHYRRAVQRGMVLQNGQVIYGQITKLAGRINASKDYDLTVSYAFTSPDGVMLHNEQTHTRNDLRPEPPTGLWGIFYLLQPRKQPRPKPTALLNIGSYVKILYADANNFIML